MKSNHIKSRMLRILLIATGIVAGSSVVVATATPVELAAAKSFIKSVMIKKDTKSKKKKGDSSSMEAAIAGILGAAGSPFPEEIPSIEFLTTTLSKVSPLTARLAQISRNLSKEITEVVLGETAAAEEVDVESLAKVDFTSLWESEDINYLITLFGDITKIKTDVNVKDILNQFGIKNFTGYEFDRTENEATLFFGVDDLSKVPAFTAEEKERYHFAEESASIEHEMGPVGKLPDGVIPTAWEYVTKDGKTIFAHGLDGEFADGIYHEGFDATMFLAGSTVLPPELDSINGSTATFLSGTQNYNAHSSGTWTTSPTMAISNWVLSFGFNQQVVSPEDHTIIVETLNNDSFKALLYSLEVGQSVTLRSPLETYANQSRTPALMSLVGTDHYVYIVLTRTADGTAENPAFHWLKSTYHPEIPGENEWYRGLRYYYTEVENLYSASWNTTVKLVLPENEPEPEPIPEPIPEPEPKIVEEEKETEPQIEEKVAEETEAAEIVPEPMITLTPTYSFTSDEPAPVPMDDGFVVGGEDVNMPKTGDKTDELLEVEGGAIALGAAAVALEEGLKKHKKSAKKEK
ncbi:hypothetical protein [Lactococcus allomyrinae]|uniref:Uncharacterized protein n=1 Tax=Lactococcus allomyrinae TaxID=2419773 RepID=A0A387BDA3_9LACT|nr:hypothetical protein [Lactococcus allomyrinae]AYG00244.1 hypothetical protein D7I46_03570 [Lactococcus allomyrinae]